MLLFMVANQEIKRISLSRRMLELLRGSHMEVFKRGSLQQQPVGTN